MKEEDIFPDNLLTASIFQESIAKGPILHGYQAVYNQFIQLPLGASFLGPDEGTIFLPEVPVWQSFAYYTRTLCKPVLFMPTLIAVPFLDIYDEVLPIQLIQTDVLPGISHREKLFFSPFFICSDASFFSDSIALHKNDAQISDEEKMLDPEITIEAPINRTELIEAPFGDKGDSLLVCWLETSQGQLPALIDPEKSGLNMPMPGMKARFRGEMLGNVAVGPYANGPVYDLYSDYLVLADCFAHCEFARTLDLFAENCTYYTRGQLRARGPEAILAALNSVREHIWTTRMNYSICYVQIMHPDCPQDAPYKDGQKALGFINGQDRLTSLICIDVNESGKISRLYTLYDFEEGANVRTTEDYHTWRYEFSEKP